MAWVAGLGVTVADDRAALTSTSHPSSIIARIDEAVCRPELTVYSKLTELLASCRARRRVVACEISTCDTATPSVLASALRRSARTAAGSSPSAISAVSDP